MAAAKYKTIKLNRLWNNLASTRDYIIRDCLMRSEGIIFTLKNSTEVMQLDPEDLRNKQITTNKTLQRSRFGKDYYLVDFAWRPDVQEVSEDKPTIVQGSLF